MPPNWKTRCMRQSVNAWALLEVIRLRGDPPLIGIKVAVASGCYALKSTFVKTPDSEGLSAQRTILEKLSTAPMFRGGRAPVILRQRLGCS